VTLPDAPTLFQVLEQTWPAATRTRIGPWMIRDGKGGGQRVSAATAEAAVTPQDLGIAEDAMAQSGTKPLFRVRNGEAALDGLLEEKGYRIGDPTLLYVTPITEMTNTPVPPVTAFQVWPPLAIMADIWAAGGIGAARLAVMDRVKGPKTAILARQADQPAGTAFVALQGSIAMIHAIEVLPALRRQGVARNILHAAGHWAQDHGADWFALAVTRANTGANKLYTALGMQVVGDYHYRIK